jgi:hypothetical protein
MAAVSARAVREPGVIGPTSIDIPGQPATATPPRSAQISARRVRRAFG